MEFQTAEYRVVGPPGCGKTTWLSTQVEEAVGASRQLPGPARACGACRRPGATTRPPRSRGRVQGSPRQAQKRRPRCCFMLWSTMIHHREGPLMQQGLSKLEAAQRLGVSPSTLDRMIRRGELEIEREGRGDRAKVWVLAPGLSSDAPGGQPVAAGPSPEAELAAAREQVRVLQELSDYRGKLLDEAEWRYRELLEELRTSQALLEGLTRALPPEGRRSHPGDGVGGPSDRVRRVFGIAPQAGAETRCTTGPTSRRLLPPGPCGFGPAVPGGGLPDRLGGVAQGPGAPARAGDPQVRWLIPVQALDAIGCQGSSSFMLCPDAGGCFRPAAGGLEGPALPHVRSCGALTMTAGHPHRPVF